MLAAAFAAAFAPTKRTWKLGPAALAMVVCGACDDAASCGLTCTRVLDCMSRSRLASGLARVGHPTSGPRHLQAHGVVTLAWELFQTPPAGPTTEHRRLTLFAIARCATDTRGELFIYKIVGWAALEEPVDVDDMLDLRSSPQEFSAWCMRSLVGARGVGGGSLPGEARRSAVAPGLLADMLHRYDTRGHIAAAIARGSWVEDARAMSSKAQGPTIICSLARAALQPIQRSCSPTARRGASMARRIGSWLRSCIVWLRGQRGRPLWRQTQRRKLPSTRRATAVGVGRSRNQCLTTRFCLRDAYGFPRLGTRRATTTCAGRQGLRTAITSRHTHRFRRSRPRVA